MPTALAGSVAYANRQHSERRIYSGFQPHGEFEATHCRRNRLIVLHIALCNPAVLLSSANQQHYQRRNLPCRIGTLGVGFAFAIGVHYIAEHFAVCRRCPCDRISPRFYCRKYRLPGRTSGRDYRVDACVFPLQHSLSCPPQIR